MSWVEDARKLMQDFVAPELRGINQRLDDLIAGMEKSFAEVKGWWSSVSKLPKSPRQSDTVPCLTG